jgi:hypothetical protein
MKPLTRGLTGALLGLMCVGGATLATPAQADHNDRYYGQKYYRGRDRDDIRHREILRNKLVDLGDRVRMAERSNRISRERARDLYNDLDRVRDFLREDRHLSDSEFDRRMDDLNDVQRDLSEHLRGRSGRGGYSNGRYGDRYDNDYRYDNDHRYDRDYRYDRDNRNDDRYRRR